MYPKATVSVPENDPDLRAGSVPVSSFAAKRSRTPFYCTPKANERPERTLVAHDRWHCPEFYTDTMILYSWAYHYDVRRVLYGGPKLSFACNNNFLITTTTFFFQQQQSLFSNNKFLLTTV